MHLRKILVMLVTGLTLTGNIAVIENSTNVQTVAAASKTKKRYRKSSKRKSVKKTKKSVKARYIKASIKLPKGYTRSALLKAYQGHPSNAFIKASMQGMNNNNFSRIKNGESARDNRTKINLGKLSSSQRKELTLFSLRLINQARKQLGLSPWVYSNGTEKLAVDIANEYQKHGRTIRQGHYVAGIVRACQKNGLQLNDNYVEDLAGFYSKKNTFTMTEAKKDIYFGLKQMLFGYAGSSESGRYVRSNYREWEHAGDLFNTQGSRHDGDYDYYGFSVSKTGHIYSLHYIGVPSFAVKSMEYNHGFKP